MNAYDHSFTITKNLIWFSQAFYEGSKWLVQGQIDKAYNSL
jgi:hypothetical protein